jgi:hypothetical protein
MDNPSQATRKRSEGCAGFCPYKIVESLPSEEKRLFHRLFHFNTATGYLKPPDTMWGWIEERFGSVEAVTSQKIVKITNLVTLEGALFNGLRACHPIEFRERLCIEDSIIDASDNHDPLHHPLYASLVQEKGHIWTRVPGGEGKVAVAVS